MSEAQIERRSGLERRHTTVAAYWRGSLQPRRRAGRRAADRYSIIDWHSPRVLALALTALALCVADGVLTIVLLAHGASEVNPVMALFVPHDLPAFAAVKLSLTAIGLCVLVACSRMRLFRAVPGEAFLYLVVGGYIALVVYELEMLSVLPLPLHAG